MCVCVCVCVCSLTVVLVLVQPLVAVVRQQLVLSEGSVDEAVDKRGGQVHTGRVHLGAATPKPWERPEEEGRHGETEEKEDASHTDWLILKTH